VLVFVRYDGSPLCCLFRERHGFAPGQPIRLMPQLSAVHLFDAQSGERIRAG
jgi:multiple sugar transport system ATP-binding protein